MDTFMQGRDLVAFIIFIMIAKNDTIPNSCAYYTFDIFFFINS